MKPHMKRGLTKVALALMLAGYCAVPVAMAEDAAWVASGTTAEFEGDHTLALSRRGECYD